jgi:hypothetical protein
LQGCDQNLLSQIVGGVRISQVTKAVQPYARTHAMEKLRFGAGISGPDLAYKVSVVRFYHRQHTFYV